MTTQLQKDLISSVVNDDLTAVTAITSTPLPADFGSTLMELLDEHKVEGYYYVQQHHGVSYGAVLWGLENYKYAFARTSYDRSRADAAYEANYDRVRREYDDTVNSRPRTNYPKIHELLRQSLVRILYSNFITACQNNDWNTIANLFVNDNFRYPFLNKNKINTLLEEYDSTLTDQTKRMLQAIMTYFDHQLDEFNKSLILFIVFMLSMVLIPIAAFVILNPISAMFGALAWVGLHVIGLAIYIGCDVEEQENYLEDFKQQIRHLCTELNQPQPDAEVSPNRILAVERVLRHSSSPSVTADVPLDSSPEDLRPVL